MPFQLVLSGIRLRFEHLRCWDEPRGDSCVCRARSRPVCSVAARAEVCPCVPYWPYGALTSHVRVGCKVSGVRVSVFYASIQQKRVVTRKFCQIN